jgi:hypothetical protein
MRHRQDSKEDRMDVLGVILGVLERARNLLGKRLGFYLKLKLSRSYRSRHSWLVTYESWAYSYARWRPGTLC